MIIYIFSKTKYVQKINSTQHILVVFHFQAKITHTPSSHQAVKGLNEAVHLHNLQVTVLHQETCSMFKRIKNIQTIKTIIKILFFDAQFTKH